jgi:hypothetical protein
MEVYVHGNGTGPFAEGPVATGLEMVFKRGSVQAGLVRPVTTVSLTQYQADLLATRAHWVVDES